MGLSYVEHRLGLWQPTEQGDVSKGRRGGGWTLLCAFFSGEEVAGVITSSPFEEALPSAKVRSFLSCSSLFTKTISTTQINGLPPAHNSRQILQESARTNVTFPLARSTVQRLCLASFVPPSRTWIPSRHTPAVRLGNTSCGSLHHCQVAQHTASHPYEKGTVASQEGVLRVSRCLGLPHSPLPVYESDVRKDQQKPLGLMYNEKPSLLSTYFAPWTTIKTLRVLAHYKHRNRPFCKWGKEGQNACPRSPAIRWKNKKLNPLPITPKACVLKQCINRITDCSCPHQFLSSLKSFHRLTCTPIHCRFIRITYCPLIGSKLCQSPSDSRDSVFCIIVLSGWAVWGWAQRTGSSVGWMNDFGGDGNKGGLVE